MPTTLVSMEDICEMIKIVLWGMGNFFEVVLKSVIDDKASVCGVIDKNVVGRKCVSNIPLYTPNELSQLDYDYLVITTRNPNEILMNAEDLSVPREKIVCYWQDDLSKIDYLDDRNRRLVEQEKEIIRLKRKLNNISYELGLSTTPIIRSAEELLRLLIRDRKSLCRFGDSEFESMRGNQRSWYQKKDEALGKRLLEILNSNDSNIIIAIADDFGNLEKYTVEGADAIREYMTDEVRADLMRLIDLNKVYYDAYVSRPYIIYKDSHNAEVIFPLFKKVWENRDILIVENPYTRMGYGNDLFLGARSIRRILCPEKNAYDSYHDIMEEVLRHIHTSDLFIASLGQTATVLAYDIAKRGYQAIDIGQLDNEYEWFRMGAKSRKPIAEKAVSELPNSHYVEACKDDIYESEIVGRVNI